MSFQLTADQVRARTKTVTRRLGWKNLKRFELLRACEKCMGLKKGESPKVLGTIRVIGVRIEPLASLILGGKYTERMSKREVIREGFPELSARKFVEMFCEHMGCKPDQIVTRIEFDYV